MIVNIRGAGGAGKSHIVHRVLKARPEMREVFVEGRRIPYGLVSRELYVLGHYRINNGGVDTIKTLGEVYETVRRWHGAGFNVLYEGKNQSDDVRYIVDLCRTVNGQFAAVTLSTPLDVCVASVRARGHRMSEELIARMHRKSERDHRRLQTAGVQVFYLDREQAYNKVEELIS